MALEIRSKVILLWIKNQALGSTKLVLKINLESRDSQSVRNLVEKETSICILDQEHMR